MPVAAPQPLSSPKLTVALSANLKILALAFPTVQGRFYAVDYCTNLATPNWQPLPKHAWGTGAPIQVSAAPSDAARFYRLRITSY